MRVLAPVGAAQDNLSAHKAQSFYFQFANNSRDFPCDVAQLYRCRPLAEPKLGVNAYLNGRSYIDVELLTLRLDPSKVESTASGSPFPEGVECGATLHGANADPCGPGVGWTNHPVGIFIPELVKGPNGPIPSFACVFANHVGDDVFVNMLAAVSVDVLLNAIGGVCD